MDHQSNRVDTHPTSVISGFEVRPGKPLPFGVTPAFNGLNFSIFTSSGKSCTLVLFQSGEKEPYAEIQIPDSYRIGNVYSIVVFGLDIENLEYGYRIDGPNSFSDGHAFDHSKVLMDPYARLISGRDTWACEPDWSNQYPYRSRVPLDDFDWDDDRQLEIPPQDLIIYELHVRGYTVSDTSGTSYPGTYAGLVEKIPYFKDLGVNAIELMPIFEYDEYENSRDHPDTGEKLYNFWGYSTLGFFAPKAGFASTGKLGMQVDEFKQLVKSFHSAGIEVILDVVFNHTAEGNERGPVLSFKGLDNKIYYMLTPEGYYFNFSGTGNTLNCNNPVVRNLVLDCLRYWVAEYHIDGFRFDLAAILGRDPMGYPLSNPPLLESLAFDPILSKAKLIAEAWDAGGLYQVGTFPAFGRWGEWNGKYRDCVRRFLKGDQGLVGELAQRVQGSPDLYESSGRSPATSVNFITCHDGFTLHDLVSYNYKHNEANGEYNRDGGDDNYSWNCGDEGLSSNEGVLQFRLRQMQNALTILFMSRGVPMLLMGDEFGRTQSGNNNAYCLDSPISWVDWSLIENNQELLDFTKALIALRNDHPSLRVNSFSAPGSNVLGLPSSSFHGSAPYQPDWSESSKQLAWLFSCDSADSSGADAVYVYANMSDFASWCDLPALPGSATWSIVINSGDRASPFTREPRSPFTNGGLLVGEHSVLVLTS